VPEDDPSRVAILAGLRHCAVEIYGEERAAEATLHTALEAAASAIWRVSQEPLGPAGGEP
jgi:hypothetical protein